MWWFGKARQRDIWDEPVQWPLGDIDAAQRIRDICRSANDSAEAFAATAERRDETDKRERERYQRAARAAMEIALKMSDELMRDASVGQIIHLCMKADDLKTARTLLRAIQNSSIREDVLRDHPVLRK